MKQKKHEYYMEQALAQAHISYAQGEVPVGAVIVDEFGVIIARGYNCTEKKKSQIGHAEIQAIIKANKKKKSWHLDGCWIYVTLEPCLMCIGLIRLSRCAGIFYGAESPIFGGSIFFISLLPYYNDHLISHKGLKAKESADILKKFFKERREIARNTCQKKLPLL